MISLLPSLSLFDALHHGLPRRTLHPKRICRSVYGGQGRRIKARWWKCERGSGEKRGDNARTVEEKGEEAGGKRVEEEKRGEEAEEKETS